MVNKRDAEVFIICLSGRFDVGLFHVIGQEVPRWRFDDTCILTMTRTCLGPKQSSMRFGYSYFMGHEVLNLWFVKHMLIIVLALTLTIQDAYDGGNESSNLVSTIIFWRFIKLAITASLCEGPFFYFYVESPPSTFMHRLREHSCHSEFNVHSPKVYL
jgi:hypothetical protein